VAGGVPLPVSRTCFACGTENAIGLGLQLAHDDATVHGRFVPDERFRERDGSVSSVAVTALLDEAAFWLGALATGESGMTTDLRLTLHRPARASDALTVVGRRTDATPGPDDERYWITRLAAVADTGDVVASAVITFVVVRGAARRLAAGLSATNPAEVVRAVFPRYVETARPLVQQSGTPGWHADVDVRRHLPPSGKSFAAFARPATDPGGVHDDSRGCAGLAGRLLGCPPGSQGGRQCDER